MLHVLSSILEEASKYAPFIWVHLEKYLSVFSAACVAAK